MSIATDTACLRALHAAETADDLNDQAQQICKLLVTYIPYVHWSGIWDHYSDSWVSTAGSEEAASTYMGQLTFQIPSEDKSERAILYVRTTEAIAFDTRDLFPLEILAAHIKLPAGE
ncbi:hypothetical protein B0H94_11081 [Salsuginibacillus halophilus]|uniref:Uncharacterized protein n=1 Tax=Salsuginibacillus halophilus TaxID=517424 RepID=A0A2P8HBK4_9BACI|nr:hypothetical protein [Salsuginibacillus halophilus]PSL43605.1 hypothetical protein B0H94_11081 [Salsuginibacillus halophilus]